MIAKGVYVVATNLVVRNVEEDFVLALKQRAAFHGRSAEAEHREILKATLQRPKRRSVAEIYRLCPTWVKTPTLIFVTHSPICTWSIPMLLVKCARGRKPNPVCEDFSNKHMPPTFIYPLKQWEKFGVAWKISAIAEFYRKPENLRNDLR
jgi:hypothetical protein